MFHTSTTQGFFKSPIPLDTYIMAGQNCAVRFDSELTPKAGFSGIGTDEINICKAVVISRKDRTRVSLIHLDASSRVESVVDEIRWINENYKGDYTINVFEFTPTTSVMMQQLNKAEQKGVMTIQRNDIKKNLQQVVAELEGKYQLKKPSNYKDDFPSTYQSIYVKPDINQKKLMVTNTIESASAVAKHEDLLTKEARFGVNEFNALYNTTRSVQLQFNGKETLTIPPLVDNAARVMNYIRGNIDTSTLLVKELLPCKANYDIHQKLKKLFSNCIDKNQLEHLPTNYLLHRAFLIRMILIYENSIASSAKIDVLSM